MHVLCDAESQCFGLCLMYQVVAGATKTTRDNWHTIKPLACVHMSQCTLPSLWSMTICKPLRQVCPLHVSAIVVVVNVGMVFCCARLVFLRVTGQELDPLAAEAAQRAAAAEAEAGEPGGGPGGGAVAGGPRIELTAVTNPNMEVWHADHLCLCTGKSW